MADRERRLTMGAASNLFYVADASKETLNRRVRPGEGQIEFLRKKKDDIEEFLRSDLAARCGCVVSTWLQGSYKLHTLIRPVHKHDDYDVDVGIYFEWGAADGERFKPWELRQHLQASLNEFKRIDASVKEVIDPPKERCSRIEYEEHFHIDTPAYHHSTDTGVARLATLSKGWELSDPEKMVQWFQERLDGDDRAQVRRITRYLKAWAALTFASEKNSLPSSLMLTVLAVDAYISAIGKKSFDDDDALREVASSIFWRLSGSRHVENPVRSDQDRNINRLSDGGFDGFMRALASLDQIATRATGARDEVEAAAIWTEAFDYLFPLPDITGIAEEDPQRGIVVPTPNIRIDVSETKGGSPVRRFENQVDLARLNEHLRFRITNPEVLPTGAKIRWVVRNVGDHAFRENDLGHSAADDGTYVHDETAAYQGRHFMDCEVRFAGQLRSITRVPVLITSMTVPPRHPKRPAYTHFRSRR
jgi:hypothetical protein